MAMRRNFNPKARMLVSLPSRVGLGGDTDCGGTPPATSVLPPAGAELGLRLFFAVVLAFGARMSTTNRNGLGRVKTE